MEVHLSLEQRGGEGDGSTDVRDLGADFAVAMNHRRRVPGRPEDGGLRPQAPQWKMGLPAFDQLGSSGGAGEDGMPAGPLMMGPAIMAQLIRKARREYCEASARAPGSASSACSSSDLCMRQPQAGLCRQRPCLELILVWRGT